MSIAGTAIKTMNRRPATLRARLDDRLLGELYDHALAAYPEECCGMIRRSGLRKCRNQQNALHRQDPANHPRTARRAFALTADDDLFLAESQDADDSVLAVYHSHPDEVTCFSATDRAAALCNGKPVYPELLHVVIACQADRVSEARVFGFVDGDYVEVLRFEGMAV